MKTRTALSSLAGVAALALALTACGSSDPLADEPTEDADQPASDTIVVGSQAYASNEIIAEVYAQALENAGLTVERQFSIGQRDAYLPSLESGEVQVFPEYTGNLLQFFDEDTEARASDDVYAALQDALPDTLTALDYAEATDQDSYTVTAAFAEENDLVTIEDLANVDGELVLGGPAELEERPYGPIGAESVYGLDLGFEATGDTTVEALQAGQIQIGNVFTADPRIATEDLVPLEDTKALFLASNVVPIVSSDVADEVADSLNAVSAKLTPDELIAMNVANTEDAQQPDEIASAWLADQGLAG